MSQERATRLHYWTAPKMRGTGFAREMGRRSYNHENDVLCHERNLGSVVSYKALRPTGIVEHVLMWGAERWRSYEAWRESEDPVSSVPFIGERTISDAAAFARGNLETGEEHAEREAQEMFFAHEVTFEFRGLFYASLVAAALAFEAATLPPLST